MSQVNKDKKSNHRPIVKQTKHVKSILLAVGLALAGIIIYTMVAGYTYQAKQKVELQNTLQAKQQLQKELEKKNLDSKENQKQIEQLTKDLQAKKDSQARAVAQSAPVKPVAPPQGVVGCGDNVYKQFIYKHESGCRTNAINSIGCAGLGQACPGSKLPCSLSDWACQDAWFSNYAIKRYGSWENAYNFWVAHRWW